MQWTSVKHIVSERVCKWNRLTRAEKRSPVVGNIRPVKNEKCSSLAFLPDFLFLTVMGGLLLHSTLRSSFQPPELLVAWGDDGVLPAVCYSSCPCLGSRQFTVLCPGGSSAASQLLFLLDKRGCARLESLFSSTAAPAPRGTQVLLKKKETAELILFVDTRLPKSGLDLAAGARIAGIAVRQLPLGAAGESIRHHHWKFCSRRGGNGDFHWSFYHLKEQVQITLFWQKNGILQLQYQYRNGLKITKQFLRTNRCGIWVSCLERR